MEIKQETKSLPRNRKCGNCRYFEPAPLWRKGWCRNPRLYDRRANHLVDASTIDCEQVFRARIYWEPVPTSSADTANTGPGYSPFVGATASQDNGYADSGRQRANSDGILRPRTGTTGQFNQPSQPQEPNLPVITRREKAAVAPGLVAKPSKARRWLVENIPYYDKIDGPISRINLLKVLPWIIIFVLLLVVLINITGGKKDASTSTTDQSTPRSTSVATTSGSLNPGQTVAVVGNNSSSSSAKPAGTPTPTLSTLVPTSTAVPPTPVTTKAVETKAKVKGTQANGLNVRKEPTTNSDILVKVPEGKLVTIRSADFKTIDGITWWPISYEGKDGWASSAFLEKV